MVTRRTMLRVVGGSTLVGLGGCTEVGGGSDNTATETATPDAPAGAVGRIQITQRDDAPDLPIEPRVSVVDPYVTPESTAVLRTAVANTSDETVVVGEYREVVFQYAYSEPTGYVLLPHSERSTEGTPARSPPDVETTDGDDCWQLTSGVAVTAEYGTVEIPAGGMLTAFVGLYATSDANACLPTGDHSFRATYALDPLTGETPAARRSWGFTLGIDSL